MDWPKRFFIAAPNIKTQKAGDSGEEEKCLSSAHIVLLTDALATSQQLPTTPNKFGGSDQDGGCVQLLAVLSTACSAGYGAAQSRSCSRGEEEEEMGNQLEIVIVFANNSPALPDFN